MSHQRTESEDGLSAKTSIPVSWTNVVPSDESEKAVSLTGKSNLPQVGSIITDVESNTSLSDTTSHSIGEEGGMQAWLTIVGAWFIMFAALGIMYSFGVFQDYYTRVLLSSHTPSAIAWIGSLQLMLPFFLGAISGKLFDAGYFHALQIAGAIILTISLFMLSLVKPQQYYQVFLSHGLGAGLGIGIMFVPAASIVVHYFKRRRALATGIVLSGGGIGSVVFPIMMNHLIPQLGFKKAVQAAAYVVLGCLAIGNALVRTSYPVQAPSLKAEKPNVAGFFKDVPYVWTLFGAILAEFGVFFPITFLQLYAVQHNIDPNIAFYSIAIINGTGAFGRISMNFLADKCGPLNLYVPCTVVNVALIFAIFGVKSEGSLLAFSIVFGLVSGAWLSLSISGVASLARRPDEVGARTGIGLAIGSFGALGAAPTQGALLTDAFLWHRPIIFSGVMLGASSICFFVARTLIAKERKTQKV